MRSEYPVAVLISGNGSNLQALIDQQQHYGYRIVQVISNRPDALGLKRAQQAKIPCDCVDHQRYPNRLAFEQALLKALNPDCELLLLAGFMRILSADFLEHLHCPALNIHPALLPHFKGLDTHQRALSAGAQEHGCSIHQVTAVLDSGPLLAQSRLKVRANDNAETLSNRVLELEHRLYPWVVGQIANQRLTLVPPILRLDGHPLPAQGYQFTNGSDQHPHGPTA